MKIKNIIMLSIIIPIIILSCNEDTAYKSNNSKNKNESFPLHYSNNVDTVLTRCNKIDLSLFTGLGIHFRGRGYNPHAYVYMIGKYNAECSPYVVSVNMSSFEIDTINNGLVLRTCDDYLDYETIERIYKEYMKVNIYSIYVDDYENVYVTIEPEGTTLLRKSGKSEPEYTINFRHYKDDWYIRE